jgi:hypothetical protein
VTTDTGDRVDALSPGTELIEVRVGELKQLFNAMDPAPFRERDLDPNAEEYIVESARELRRDAPLALQVHLSRQTPTHDEAAMLQQAVRDYFAHRAAAARTRLRQLFRTGRWTLLIGLAFVAAANLVGDAVANLVGSQSYGGFLHESIVIGAWVALWRPMEIFLYDWWPILGDARLFDRLSAMPVRVVGSAGVGPGANT